LRYSIAKRRERHPFKDDIGQAAICRRLPRALARADKAVRQLILTAGVEPPRYSAKIQLLSICPDSTNPRNFSFHQADSEIRIVAVFNLFGRAAAASTTLAATGHFRGDDFFLKVRRPNHLSTDTGPSIDTRNRRALRRSRNAQIGEARAGEGAILSGYAKERLVDERAGECADLRADRRACDGSAEHAQS